MVDSTSVFSPPDFKNHSPLTWYQAAQQQPGFIEDVAQFKAIKLLDKLWAELMMFKRKRNRFLGRSLRSPQSPRGLYFYGGVGRGKSFLMDVFYGCLPYRRKRRVHFHAFMAEVHQRMAAHKSEANPLQAVAAEIAAEVRVLCFDEFHVHDIGDAMLLTRLFNALFSRGVFLLVTSNYAPEGLLPNPLYHERFLPVIRLINSSMEVLEVGGDTDFRSLPANREQQRFTQGHYVWPGTAAQRQALQVPAPRPVQLNVNKRPLRALAVDGRRVVLGFDDLCEKATAVIDYLVLAEQFDEWVIDGLDDLADCSLAAQQRFVNLVDVLYDQDRQVTVIGKRPLEESLGGPLADLMRTRSRLGQLQVVGPQG